MEPWTGPIIQCHADRIQVNGCGLVSPFRTEFMKYVIIGNRGKKPGLTYSEGLNELYVFTRSANPGGWFDGATTTEALLHLPERIQVGVAVNKKLRLADGAGFPRKPAKNFIDSD